MNPTPDSVLHRIAHSVKNRLEERKGRLPEQELRAIAAASPRPRDFLGAFRGNAKGATASTSKVIAEVKFASPSQGLIHPGAARPGTAAAAVEVALEYSRNGATALSVLTEQDHFGGKLEYLASIRAAAPEALLLMKDFVLEEYQLLEARKSGADAALLIVALLGESRTAELMAAAHSLGLTALVEVHDEDELAIASRIGARLVGVNNRNLKTLRISLETSYRLAPLAAAGAVLISESGIEAGAEMAKLAQAGYSGFLVGTSLMRTGSPGRALAQLLSEAR